MIYKYDWDSSRPSCCALLTMYADYNQTMFRSISLFARLGNHSL